MVGITHNYMAQRIADTENGDDTTMRQNLLKKQVEIDGIRVKLFTEIEPTQHTSTSGRWLFVTNAKNYTAAAQCLDSDLPQDNKNTTAENTANIDKTTPPVISRPSRPTNSMVNYAQALTRSLRKLTSEITPTHTIKPIHPQSTFCLLYTSPSPRDGATSRMPSSA